MVEEKEKKIPILLNGNTGLDSMVGFIQINALQSVLNLLATGELVLSPTTILKHDDGSLEVIAVSIVPKEI